MKVETDGPNLLSFLVNPLPRLHSPISQSRACHSLTLTPPFEPFFVHQIHVLAFHIFFPTVANGTLPKISPFRIGLWGAPYLAQHVVLRGSDQEYASAVTWMSRRRRHRYRGLLTIKHTNELVIQDGVMGYTVNGSRIHQERLATVQVLGACTGLKAVHGNNPFSFHQRSIKIRGIRVTACTQSLLYKSCIRYRRRFRGVATVAQHDRGPLSPW